jgi:hypothetical protein
LLEVSGWTRKPPNLSVLKASAAVQDRAGLIEMPYFSANAGFGDPCDFLTNCVQQSNLRC